MTGRCASRTRWWQCVTAQPFITGTTIPLTSSSHALLTWDGWRSGLNRSDVLGAERCPTVMFSLLRLLSFDTLLRCQSNHPELVWQVDSQSIVSAAQIYSHLSSTLVLCSCDVEFPFIQIQIQRFRGALVEGMSCPLVEAPHLFPTGCGQQKNGSRFHWASYGRTGAGPWGSGGCQRVRIKCVSMRVGTLDASG